MKYRIIIDLERCKGCTLCVAVCPHKVLVMSGTLNARGAHYAVTQNQRACAGCLQCTDICPDAAIEIELGEETN